MKKAAFIILSAFIVLPQSLGADIALNEAALNSHTIALCESLGNVLENSAHFEEFKSVYKSASKSYSRLGCQARIELRNKGNLALRGKCQKIADRINHAADVFEANLGEDNEVKRDAVHTINAATADYETSGCNDVLKSKSI